MRRRFVVFRAFIKGLRVFTTPMRGSDTVPWVQRSPPAPTGSPRCSRAGTRSVRQALAHRLGLGQSHQDATGYHSSSASVRARWSAPGQVPAWGQWRYREYYPRQAESGCPRRRASASSDATSPWPCRRCRSASASACCRPWGAIKRRIRIVSGEGIPVNVPRALQDAACQTRDQLSQAALHYANRPRGCSGCSRTSGTRSCSV